MRRVIRRVPQTRPSLPIRGVAATFGGIRDGARARTWARIADGASMRTPKASATMPPGRHPPAFRLPLGGAEDRAIPKRPWRRKTRWLVIAVAMLLAACLASEGPVQYALMPGWVPRASSGRRSGRRRTSAASRCRAAATGPICGGGSASPYGTTRPTRSTARSRGGGRLPVRSVRPDPRREGVEPVPGLFRVYLGGPSSPCSTAGSRSAAMPRRAAARNRRTDASWQVPR